MKITKRLAAAYDARLVRMSARDNYLHYLRSLQSEWDRRTK